MYIELLIKIKNATAAGKDNLKGDYSMMNASVAGLLERLGYLKNVETKGRGIKKYLEMDIHPKKKIKGLKIISKPSKHVYAGYKDFRKVKGGTGHLVITTSSGIMSAEEAKKKKLGGEKLFEIW